jgi:hypothetical protein
LGVLPGIIGSIQALEAIKLLLDLGDPLVGRLLAYDALEESFRTFKVRRDPDCPACGENAPPIVIAEYDDLCMPTRPSRTAPDRALRRAVAMRPGASARERSGGGAGTLRRSEPWLCPGRSARAQLAERRHHETFSSPPPGCRCGVHPFLCEDRQEQDCG